MKPLDPSLELKPLVPPEPLLPHHLLPLWGWYGLAIAVVVIAVAIVIALRLARRAKAESPENIREFSYQQAISSLAAASHERLQEVATRISSALRLYLSRVSGDPALYETHEEFVARHEVLTKYPEELRTSTATIFSELARLKYGREAKGDPEQLIAGARDLLDRLHTVPTA